MGGSSGFGIILRGQVAPCVIRACAQQKPLVRAPRPYQQHQRILLRLRDLINAPAHQHFFHLSGHKPQRQSIHRHRRSPPKIVCVIAREAAFLRKAPPSRSLPESGWRSG